MGLEIPLSRFYDYFDGPFSGALETGGQLGLSLGFACLAGLPYANRTRRFVASGIGGAIPMVFKDAATHFGEDGSEELRRAAAAERLLNFFELGAGIAAALLPVREMILVGGLSSLFAESIRQQVIWDRSGWPAEFSTALSPIVTLTLGSFFLLPRYLRRGPPPFQAWWGKQASWSRVEEAFPSGDGQKWLGGVRRHVAEPDPAWCQDAVEGVCLGVVPAVGPLQLLLKRITSGGTHPEPEMIIRLVRETLDRLERGRSQLTRIAQTHRHYYGPNARSPALWRLYSLIHEWIDECARIDNAFRYAWGGGSSSVVADGMGASLGVVGMMNLSEFHGARPRFRRALRLAQEGFSLDGSRVTVVWKGRPQLSREALLSAVCIQRELVRNGLKASRKMGIRQPPVTIRVLPDRIETINEAGPFRFLGNLGEAVHEGMERGLLAGEVGGHGLIIADGLAQAHGWRLRADPFAEGARFFLKFGRRG